MADATIGTPGGPPKAAFRFDMLWNDSRYRSSFLQVVALFVVLLVLLYLANNVRVNLAALGKDFSFGFMSTPASYDINQQPIDYSSRDSHARAAVLGMLNTMLVAILGCFLATVIGVLAGVARLSKNWLIRQLMTVYIEVVRNVPVLIQILLIAAVINESLPQPKDFRGEDAVAAMIFSDSIAATNRGLYLPRPVWGDGSLWVIVAFILSIIAMVSFNRWRTNYQRRTGLEVPSTLDAAVWPAAVITGLLVAYFFYRIGTWSILAEWGFPNPVIGGESLNIDLLGLIVAGGLAFMLGRSLTSSAAVLLLILTIPVILIHFLFGQPVSLDYASVTERGIARFEGGLYLRDSYVALTVALSIYTGAFIAENVRAGIQAVSKGQTEAAFALGLQPGRTMSLVILPQALRIIIPPLISQYLNLTKNSSLALLVGYMDATGTLMGITLNQTGKEFETLFLGMAFYLSVSLSIAAVMNLYNKNAQLVERTSATGIGFSFMNFFGGKWDNLKKGDAKMRPSYGIRGVLNLYVLFYGAILVFLLNFIFIERAVLDVHLDAPPALQSTEAIQDALSGDLPQALAEAYLPGGFDRLKPEDVQKAIDTFTARPRNADATVADIEEAAIKSMKIKMSNATEAQLGLALEMIKGQLTIPGATVVDTRGAVNAYFEATRAGATVADIGESLKVYLSVAPKGEVIDDHVKDLFRPALLDLAQQSEPPFEIRPSYWHWTTTLQFAALGMILMAFAALITCLFKNASFFDMAAIELIVFLLAFLIGFPFGDLIPGVSALLVLGVGLLIRIGILAWTVVGAGPNLTFFNRERRA